MKDSGVSAIVTVTMPATKAVSDGHSALDRRRGGEQHEGEFARLRQEQRDPDGVVVRRTEEPREPVEQRRLDAHHDDHGEPDPPPAVQQVVRVDGHADGDEEETEEDAAEGLDVGLELVAEGGIGQHQPGKEGAHRHGKAGEFHERRGAEHDEKRRRRHHLARPRQREHAEERVEQIAPAEQKHRERADRLQDVARAAGAELRAARRKYRHDGEERHDGEVLEEERRRRLLAVGGDEVAALGQRLHAEGRRRHRKAEADDDGGLDAPAVQGGRSR